MFLSINAHSPSNHEGYFVGAHPSDGKAGSPQQERMKNTRELADKKPKRSLRIRVLKWILIFVALVVTVRVADYIWYRIQIPAGFADANWSGRWETHQYGLSGRLLVHIPDPIPEDVPFKAEASVYYPIYSFWKTGQFEEMEFQGEYSPDTATTGGTTPSEPGEARDFFPKKAGKLRFSGTAGDQVVEYVGIIDDFGSQIIGSYVSKSPPDIGFFHIGKD